MHTSTLLRPKHNPCVIRQQPKKLAAPLAVWMIVISPSACASYVNNRDILQPGITFQNFNKLVETCTTRWHKEREGTFT